MFRNKNYISFFRNLNGLFEQFISLDNLETQPIDEFIINWLDFFEYKFKIDFSVYCYASLVCFDKNYTSDRKSGIRKTLIKQGPLNELINEKVLFFNNSPNGYFEEYLLENKIREGRKRIALNPTDLNSCFKNFHIVKTSLIGNYKPLILKYNKNIEFDHKTKIGIVPCEAKNATFVFNSVRKTLSIEYNEENFEKHLRFILDTLKVMDDNGYKIVIFPEIFLFPDTAKKLSKKLCRENYNNVKLIFTGSHWSDRKNCSYILSSSGTFLCSHRKKVAYEEYKEEDKTLYKEDIETDNSFEFLDVRGIGRISYLVSAQQTQYSKQVPLHFTNIKGK